MNNSYPFDGEFQIVLLSLLARDSVFLKDNSSVVKPTFFENPLLAKICYEIINYGNTFGNSPSKIILLDILKNNSNFLLYKEVVEKLYQVDISDSDYVSINIRNFAKQQAVKRALILSEKLLQIGDYDTIQKELYKALQVGSENQDYAHEFFGGIEDLETFLKEESQARYKIPTLISCIDDVLDGGISPGEINIVMGSTGMGKSVWLINMAYAALFSRKNVLFVSLELARPLIETRLASRITGIPVKNLKYSLEDVVSKIREFQPMMGEMRTQFWPSDYASVPDIRNLLENLNRKENFRPDLVIVDYLELLNVPGVQRGDSNEFLRQGTLSTTLRGLAGEFGIGLWTATQANKGAIDKVYVGVANKAESFRVMGDADVVVSLSRTPADVEKGQVILSSAKFRNVGMKNPIEVLKGDYSRMYIGDL